MKCFMMKSFQIVSSLSLARISTHGDIQGDVEMLIKKHILVVRCKSLTKAFLTLTFSVIDPHGQTSSDTSKDCHTDASIHCNKGQTSYCGSPCRHSITDESFQASLELSRRPSSEVNASHNDMLKLYDSPSYQTSSDASKDFSCVSPKHPPQPSGIKLKIKLPREEMLQINNVNDGTNEEVISNHNEEKTMKQLPTTAKALLSSGLLEGSRVYYQYRGNEVSFYDQK